MKRYESYKESGLEWLGDIPEHWEIKPVKYISDNYDFKRIPLSSSERAKRRGDYPYYGATGIIDYVKDFLFDGEFVLIGEDGAPFFIEGKDVSFIAKGKFWVNNHAHILKPKKRISSALLSHYLNCVDYRNYITGSTRDKLTQDQLSGIKIPLPTADEQTAIAEFLDRKTADIDHLIANKERLIALYEAEKTAVINESVTKGINPNVRHKDSGIKWLGEIPEHWEVKKLKYVAKFKYGNSLTAQNRENGNINVYGSNGIVGIHNKSNSFDETIIIGRKGSFGKVNYSPSSCFIIDTAFYIDRTCTNSYLPWLNHILTLLQLDANNRDSAVPGLNREEAHERIIPVPEQREQYEIVLYIKEKTNHINRKINNTKKMIELLKEYRTALISEAVTGKIKVIDE